MSMIAQIPAEAYLWRRNINFSVVPHRGAYTTIAEARALGIPADEVLKAVLLRLDGGYAMAVVPGSRRLDMELVRRATGGRGRVRLATESEIERAFPEFELGALPPLPGALGVPGYVDPAVLEEEVVAFAAGKRTESLIVSPRELFWGEEIFVRPISRGFQGYRRSWA